MYHHNFHIIIVIYIYNPFNLCVLPCMMINQDSDEKYHKMFKAEFDVTSGRYTLSFEVKTKRGSNTVYLVPDNGKKRDGRKMLFQPSYYTVIHLTVIRRQLPQTQCSDCKT